MAAEPEQAKPAPELVNWLEISGHKRLEAWRQLVSFVDTMVDYYGLKLSIRPCCWQHVDAIEELTALWLFRVQCYSDPKNLGAAMNWFATMQRSVGRLREKFASCLDLDEQ